MLQGGSRAALRAGAMAGILPGPPQMGPRPLMRAVQERTEITPALAVVKIVVVLLQMSPLMEVV
ncbi:hypothetical protein DRJ74_15435, partial [Enterococcus faecalis]